STKPSDGNSTS
nr:Chain P, antigenic region 139-148 of Hepatitis B surface antigen protein [Hepatitis B virus]